VFDGQKCSGQTFAEGSSKHHHTPAHRQSAQTTEASQYDCEQLAFTRQHAFYQYHAGKGLCATEDGCFSRSPIEALGWAVYRNDKMWPLKASSQSCSNKKKDIRIAASQMACQQAALDRVKPGTNVADPATYYTWNAYSKKCRVSKKCNNKTEKDNFATYQNPRQMASKGL